MTTTHLDPNLLYRFEQALDHMSSIDMEDDIAVEYPI